MKMTENSSSCFAKASKALQEKTRWYDRLRDALLKKSPTEKIKVASLAGPMTSYKTGIPYRVKFTTSIKHNKVAPMLLAGGDSNAGNAHRCPVHLFMASSATQLVRSEDEELKKFAKRYVAGIVSNATAIVASEKEGTHTTIPAKQSSDARNTPRGISSTFAG